MKELIVLSIFFFTFGVGDRNQAIRELSDLKRRGEIRLNSMKASDHLIKSELDKFFTKLSELTLSVNAKIIDDGYSNLSTKLNEINLPLHYWISETSKQMRAIDVYLKVLQLHQMYGEKTLTDFPLVLPDSFVGDCNFSFPNEKPVKKLNTNDIYAYQNKMNCEREGSEEFECGSGECIGFNRTCDGLFDCWDGSDELGECEEDFGCEGCSEFCLLGPRGPQCVAECPEGFNYYVKFPRNLKPFKSCIRESPRKPISAKCMLRIWRNLLDTTEENNFEFMVDIIMRYSKLIEKCQKNISDLNCAMLYKTNSLGDETRADTARHPTTRHSTWHPTTRHPTWHPTTRHPTWHPTTRHPTWHPTTRHPTWHPTTRHPTWHPTTRHPTWHPTTRHPTWHPTTSHPTWNPTTRHPTWHPTTRHPTWHPTTWHPTWHPTTRHPTWHPTTRHPTWHPTTRPTTWNPTVGESSKDLDLPDYSFQTNGENHHTTKRTTPHSTTTHHTTKHTTKHKTHHTTTPTPTPTTPTTPPTTTTSKSTISRSDLLSRGYVILG